MVEQTGTNQQDSRDGDARRLRSNSRSSTTDNTDSLFQFDTRKEIPDYTKWLKLRYAGNKLNRKEPVEWQQNRQRSSIKLTSSMEPITGPVPLDYQEDPLDDSLYIPYHRRKEREEKRETILEREYGAREAEKMELQLNQLESANWKLHITQITRIDDPGDKEEMENKREWTLQEIMALLQKYKVWRQRETELRKNAVNHDEDTKQPSQSPTPPANIQFKPMKKTNRRSSFKTAASKQQMPFRSFYKNPTRRLKFDDLIGRKCRPDIWAFGESIPLLAKKEFDIPDGWKP